MRLTLKSKLILFTLLISLVISASIVTTALITQESSIQREYTRKALTLANLLSKSTINAIYELKIHELVEILSSATDDRDVITAWVIDEEGLILNDGTGENALEAEEPPQLSQYLLTASSNNRAVHWITAENTLSIISPVNTANGEQIGSIYLELSLLEARRTLHQQILSLVSLSVGLFLVGMLIAYFAAIKLLRPIQKMRDMTHQIAQGNYNIRLASETRDELGILAEDINDMCFQIQHTTVSKNYVNNIIDSMNDSLFVIDENGHIISTNRALRVLLGYRPKELIGQSANMLFDQPAIENNRKIDTREDIYFKCHSGELIPISLNISHFFEAGTINNKPSWVVAEAQDIREQKKAADKLLAALTDAKAGSLAKSQFLATVSHEIRTPLNGIMGMSEILQNTTLDQEQADYLKLIKQSSNNLLEIIDKILNYSQIDANMIKLEPVPIDLREICEECYQLSAPNAEEKQLDFSFDYPDSCERNFLGDPLRLRQIFLNLIGNAIKFTNSGHIYFSVSGESSDNEMQLLFKIEDTGIGFDENQIDYYLMKFTQGDQGNTRNYGGTGLGLAITKQLVTMMGGELEAHSTPGQGSTFCVKLRLQLAG